MENVEIIEPEFKSVFSKINSFGIIGVNAYPVEIEVDISSGMPNFILVGLPDTAVNESRERVRSAIKSSGYEFPSKKIIVNLAPADTKKAGPNYDLPIAIGILSCMEVLDSKNLENLWVVGELGLSGKIRSINGVLSHVICAKRNHAKGILVPKDNQDEASLITDINIYPVDSLLDAIHTVKNLEKSKPYKLNKTFEKSENYLFDFSDVKGQSLAKRAMEISAAGEHHILMIGSPGSGKTMLSQRLITILPELSYEERIEVTQIYSASGKLAGKEKIILNRPFRSPHHSASIPGLIGGGSIPQPGEISLAHRGVLFLDELTEFQKQVLDSLRQTLENKEITISRSRRSCTFLSDFILVAACNPCPCGYLGDSLKQCLCSQNEIRKYLKKISGPVLDRIDLQVEVKRLSEEELLSSKSSENSKSIKSRILAARDIQSKRYKKDGKLNSNLSNNDISEYCKLSKAGELLLRDAIKTFLLTARSYNRLLKVSRTIADLDNSPSVKDEHLLEALQFRLNNFYK